MTDPKPVPSRRHFLRSTSAVAAGTAALNFLPNAFARANDTIKVGLIGCGGRGTGARGVAASHPGRRYGGDRHDLARVGRYHRRLIEVVKFLTRRRANAFGSEIGFGHVWNPGNF